MSTRGGIIGGILGAVAGFFFLGGPIGALRGAMLGAGVGMYLDPPKGPNTQGPRLDDLTVQTSTYGAVIPRVYGTMATSGNVFWLENNQLKEVSTKEEIGGGSGGGDEATHETFEYFATFAVGLAQHKNGVAAQAVKRIWIRDKLVYDASSTDVSTHIANGGVNFRFYPGDDTQQPDPRMQAALGAANTPAYRGLCYVVFYDLPLKDYFNSLAAAQVKVELVTSGTMGWTGAEKTTLPVDTPYAIAYNDTFFVTVGMSTATGAVTVDANAWEQTTLPASTTWQTIVWAPAAKKFLAVVNGAANYVATGDQSGKVWKQETLPDSSYSTGAATDGKNFCIVSGSGVGNNKCYYSTEIPDTTEGAMPGTNTRRWDMGTLPAISSWVAVEWSPELQLWCAISSTISGYPTSYAALSADRSFWTSVTLPSNSQWRALKWNGSFFLAVGGGVAATSVDGVTWVARTCPITAEALAWNGQVFCASGGNSAAITTDGITWTLVSGMPASSGRGWSSITPAGGVFMACGNNGKVAMIAYTLNAGTVTLASVVEQEMLESKLLASTDIDVTALTDTVRGYKVQGVSAIRGGIEPLQGMWPFDIIQSGYKIKSVKRGGASVASIPSTLLDARRYGDEPGVSITESREMDSVIYSKVGVKHLDPNREYDIGEQYAERLNTDAVNSMVMDVALSLTAQEAAQKAEVLLYMYWMERQDLKFSLPPSYVNLEPSDIITITGDTTYQVRLSSLNYTSAGHIECDGKFSSPSVYTSTATGASSQFPQQTLGVAGATLYELLDLPLLKDTYNTPGFALAMTGYLTGWPSGVLYQSSDAGQTWSALASMVGPGSRIGYATTVLGTHDGRMMDKASTLTVKMYQGTLSSVSELQLLNGSNYFAYGVDGRWEIIGAQNAVLQGDGSYILTDFIRGAFGTEWATGLHAVNDRVVYLGSSELVAVAVNSSIIGLPRDYRGITTGKTIDSDGNKVFTYRGVNLECLSPVYLNGNRHPTTNDWTLTWIRRGRVSPAWRDLVDVPVGESVESYEIDIFADSTYATVKRTLTSTSASVSYTSANQVTDFGANQSTLYVKVYQMSATVGRGYPLTASITR